LPDETGLALPVSGNARKQEPSKRWTSKRPTRPAPAGARPISPDIKIEKFPVRIQARTFGAARRGMEERECQKESIIAE